MNIVLRDYKPTDISEIGDLNSCRPSRVIPILEKFNQGERHRVNFDVSSSATVLMNKYIESLRAEGLDIGRGECAFGYQMPLPKREEIRRDLIIFRRK